MTLKGSHTNSPECNSGKGTVGENHYGVVAQNKNKGRKHTQSPIPKKKIFKKKNRFRKIL